MPESRRHAVYLDDVEVGTLQQRGDHARFLFVPQYRDLPQRPVLGLRFEEQADEGLSATLRLPPWFSNVLPENRLLRSWIAADRRVSPRRELELLLRIGHDLPGAVRVLESGGEPWPDATASRTKALEKHPHKAAATVVEFSLALKPGASVRVRTGAGKNTTRDLYWQLTRYVWNNDRDTATLRNGAGKVIEACSYNKPHASQVRC